MERIRNARDACHHGQYQRYDLSPSRMLRRTGTAIMLGIPFFVSAQADEGRLTESGAAACGGKWAIVVGRKMKKQAQQGRQIAYQIFLPRPSKANPQGTKLK